MRHQFFKRSVAYASQLQRRSTEKFDCRIDPEVKKETTSTSGSRVICPAALSKKVEIPFGDILLLVAYA